LHRKANKRVKLPHQHNFKYKLVVQNNCLQYTSLKLLEKGQLNETSHPGKNISRRKMNQEHSNLLPAFILQPSPPAEKGCLRREEAPVSAPHRCRSCEPCTPQARSTSCLLSWTALLSTAGTPVCSQNTKIRVPQGPSEDWSITSLGHRPR